ncbi:unnamed protein product [Closterium sp. Yama58-4]|nr:unnamed protein product [Closterium sp. Yama58-4]
MSPLLIRPGSFPETDRLPSPLLPPALTGEAAGTERELGRENDFGSPTEKLLPALLPPQLIPLEGLRYEVAVKEKEGDVEGERMEEDGEQQEEGGGKGTKEALRGKGEEGMEWEGRAGGEVGMFAGGLRSNAGIRAVVEAAARGRAAAAAGSREGGGVTGVGCDSMECGSGFEVRWQQLLSLRERAVLCGDCDCSEGAVCGWGGSNDGGREEGGGKWGGAKVGGGGEEGEGWEGRKGGTGVLGRDAACSLTKERPQLLPTLCLSPPENQISTPLSAPATPLLLSKSSKNPIFLSLPTQLNPFQQLLHALHVYTASLSSLRSRLASAASTDTANFYSSLPLAIVSGSFHEAAMAIEQHMVSNWFINARVRIWKPMVEEMCGTFNNAPDAEVCTDQDSFRVSIAITMPNRGPGAFSQDWDPVVIHKRPQKAADTKDPKLVNAARRQGAAIESVKKYDAGTNKSGASNPAMHSRKLAEETDVLAHEKVSADVKTAIQKARLDAKLTQAQLAQKINEKPQVVQEYESGKAIPNPQILGKMERVLGVKLRGKLK